MDKQLSPTEQKREEYIQERLEAFTMAAMQGLCANPHFNPPVKNNQAPEDVLAECAIKIARATLSELSKQK